MEADHWTGCYEGGWQGVIVPEAFSHPAKFSYALTGRMFRHAIAQGWLRPGDVVADPFGGVGCGGIVAAYSDIQWVGCELEQKFVDLAKENFELHRRGWEKLKSPQPQIIQGDSRQLASLIGQVECVVSSPPFHDQQPSQASQEWHQKRDSIGKRNSLGVADGYGETPGNLGNLKEGSIDAILSSPPYAETLKGDGTQSETAAESRAKRKTAGGSLGQSQRTQGYGNKGNLGNLKAGTVDAVVGSPPYQECVKANGDRIDWSKVKEGGTKRTLARKTFSEAYGTSPGQLGNDKGPTFWQAAKEIVEQCHKILRPGGHCLWVLKAFVRKGRRVDFPGDWRRLCESVGFETVCEHHAMLVKEETHNGLFGEIKEKTEKKSFFRRLAESKGSPEINWEVVLCMERTEQGTLELQ